MCLENKKMIVLRFVLFFGVVFLVLGCTGCRDDDPNARYIGVVSEGDCDKKEGYWYNNECWSNVTDNSIAPNEVDAYVDRYVRAKEFSKLYMGDIEYQILEVVKIPGIMYGVVTIKFLMDGVVYNLTAVEIKNVMGFMFGFMLLYEPNARYDFSIDYSELPSSLTCRRNTCVSVEIKNVMGFMFGFMLLYEPNARYDFSIDYSELPSSLTVYKELIITFVEETGRLVLGGGMVSFNHTKEKDMDVLIWTVNGTLEMFDGTSTLFDLHVSLDEMIINGGGNSTLSIEGDKAYLNGVLSTETYIQIRGLQKHPEVRTLVLQRVPGSINGMINMHTGRLVRKLGLMTYLPSDGKVDSGGVHLFAAGVERIVERGGRLGIHVWCCVGDVPVNENILDAGVSADELVDTHPAHRYFIEYLTEVMGEKLGQSFYFRTIKAAPIDGIYIMTEDEMIQSGIATKIIDPFMPQ